MISKFYTGSCVFCDDKNTLFFNKQPSCYGPNVKNSANVKQLAKQLPTLKALMVKNLVLYSEQKTLLFQIKFTKIEFLHKFFLARDN